MKPHKKGDITMYLSLLGNLSLWRAIQTRVDESNLVQNGFDESGRYFARSVAV